MRFFFIGALVLLLSCRAKEEPVDPSLPVPVVTPGPGKMAVNSVIRFSGGAGVPEYSVNGGNWVRGDSLVLFRSADLRVRTRAGGRVSAAIEGSYQLVFQRVLLIGNSITRHPPAPEVGWAGDWGMAASAADRDFASLLRQELAKRNAATEWIVTNKGSTFEGYFGRMSLPDHFGVEKAFAPDLIILRIGDNLDEKTVISNGFEKAFDEFVLFLTGEHFRGKVICTGAFFDRPQASAAIARICRQRGYDYAELASLNVRKYTAYGQFLNPAVAEHPSDAGMEEIANRIKAFF